MGDGKECLPLSCLLFLFVCFGRCVACGISGSPTRDRALPPALGEWSLYHWTAKEVPLVSL